MIEALVLGAGLGLGLVLLGWALVPARTPLPIAAQRLSREGHLRLEDDVDLDQSAVARLGRLLVPMLGEGVLVRRSIRADLAVVGMPVEIYAGRKCLFTLAGIVYVPVMAAVLTLAGVSIPIVFPLWASLIAGALGFFLPDVLLASEAAERRKGFRHALGSFVDVMVMLLAANEGTEGALFLAADSGDGWAFNEIRKALREAQLQGETPWRALDRLGREMKIEELVELAASASLAGTEGASVRRSLIAKAASLRAHALAAEEAEAQAASARMTLPILVMLAGFMLFVGYPALQLVTTGF